MKNNNVSHEFYERMKNKSTEKSYAYRFKFIKFIMTLGSFFGNFASIFFAFFFFTALFSSSFISIGGMGLTIGIITFLSLFELLKRYVFDQFSHKYIINSKTLFSKNMSGFIISTLILISFSFFFSMSGAQKFMNKDKEIQTEKRKTLENETDSISNYYMSEYIKPIKEENKEYLKQKSEILSQRNEWVKKGWNTKSFDENINKLDDMIQQNKDKISKYENKREEKISEFKEEYLEIIEKESDSNKMNIIWFLLISATIEILILSGIYFNRHYQNQVVKEYEKNVASTPNFKKWKKCKEILKMIYETGVNVDEPISSTNEITELVSINDLNISKNDVEMAFKVFGHLKFYERSGNRRILKLNEEEANLSLKNHFKIK